MTTTTRATARWTKGFKKVAAVLAVGGVVFATVAVGAFTVAPAVQACPSWCQEYQVFEPGGNGQYCSVTGETKTLSWDGAWSKTVEYPKVGAVGSCQYATEQAAKDAALLDAQTKVAVKKATATSGYTEGACVPKYVCETVTRHAGDEAMFCNADGRDQVVGWSGTGTSQFAKLVARDGQPYSELTCQRTQAEAIIAAQGAADRAAALDKDAKTANMTVGACTRYACTPVGAVDDVEGQFCSTDNATVTFVGEGEGSATYPVEAEKGYYLDELTCDATTEAAALELAQADATSAAVADMNAAAAESGATPGACTVTQSWVGEATTRGAVEYCTVEGETVTLDYTGFGRVSSPVSQAEADYQATLVADREAEADLLAKTPTGAVPGACPVSPTSEPDVVAPVLPATVTEEPEAVAVPAPATVPVPAAAKPMPASIPAGDGSTVPQAPVALLALLGLAAAAAVTSGLRMATTR